MISSKPGKSTSKAEVTHVSKNGIWLFAKGREFILSYSEYPWFKEARLSELQNVEFVRGYHLYWKDLDVDLEIQSIENPGQYPLQYR